MNLSDLRDRLRQKADDIRKLQCHLKSTMDTGNDSNVHRLCAGVGQSPGPYFNHPLCDCTAMLHIISPSTK